MKKGIIFIVFILLSSTIYSQLLVKKEDIPKFITGFHYAASFGFGKDNANNHYHDVMLEAEPYFGYFPVKNLGFGPMVGYLYANSTDNNYKDLYSFGIFSRYYLPFQMNNDALKKHKLYFEYNINLTNYEYEKSYVYPQVYDKLQKIRMNYVLGININLTNEFYVDLGIEYLQFLNGIGFVEPRLAFEYHFNK